MAGSIEKRGENSYRLTVCAGYEKEGKKVKHTKTFKGSKKEAEKALALFVAEIEKGTYQKPSKMTLEEFSEIWFEDYGVNLAPKSLYRYKQLFRTHIIPAMGHLKLEQIKPLHLLEFYANLREDGARLDGKEGGLSDRTICYYHKTLYTMFECAVKWQLLASNPAERVDTPKYKKKEVQHFDEDQTRTILETLADEPIKYRTIIILAIYTGFREGEVMGLEWKNIDIENGFIRIIQESQYVPTYGNFVKSPKTTTSARGISIPKTVIDLLKTYRTWWDEQKYNAGSEWIDTDRLFVRWNGVPMHTYTPYNWFTDFLVRHNLPHVSVHGLRHTNATILIAQGLNVRTVSSRLGHSNVSTTLNIYSHSLKSADKEAAEKLEKVLAMNSKTKEKNMGTKGFE